MAYGARRAQRQIHAGKVFLWFFLVLFPALGVLCVLRATMFTAFTEKAVFDSSFGSLGVPTEHLYTDVRDIYFARKYHARFEDRDLPRHVIVFKDGSQWRTDGESGGRQVAEGSGHGALCVAPERSARHPRAVHRGHSTVMARRDGGKAITRALPMGRAAAGPAARRRF